MTPPLDPKAEQERLAQLEKDIEEGRRHADDLDTSKTADGRETFTGSDDAEEEAVAEAAGEPIDDAIAPPG